MRCSSTLSIGFRRFPRWLGLGLLSLTLFGGADARADLANFDLSARIYTKFLLQNNDSQGVLTLGNPHPQGDNFSGSNGIGTEGELTVTGRLGPRVSTGMRIQSRFGSVWQDWWENGNASDKAALSGETLGMDHAQYMKLRGVFLRLGTESDLLRWVTIGASDLSMFNPWTIGKIRYIDRDNAAGVFLEGAVGEDAPLTYHAALIALPKLFVGPGWSTGFDDLAIDTPLITRDFAYGLKVGYTPNTDWSFTLVNTFTDDLEIDRADPDATGSLLGACADELGIPVPGCDKDHAVALIPRYRNLVSTLEVKGLVSDWLIPELLVAHSLTRLGEDVAANGVANNAGIFPVLYKDTGGSTADLALRARLELEDLGGTGVGLKIEYFNIGSEFSTVFGARREADVLLTDGIAGPDQLPTLNLANEFIDFDERWVESCIGWHGATLLLGAELGPFAVDLEGTGMTYNTNQQGRDTASIYPDFQHNQGFTDTDLYDYANTLDRGRDPRAVYLENQDRLTLIAMLRLQYALPFGTGWSLAVKGKLVRDTDGRSLDSRDDDYAGTLLTARAELVVPVARWLTLTPGFQIDRWDEQNRSGDINLGYEDYTTGKEKPFVGARIEYSGVTFAYYLEYLNKVQDREKQEDQLWSVLRSKGTVEVAW